MPVNLNYNPNTNSMKSFMKNSHNTKVNKINSMINQLELTILEQSVTSLTPNQSDEVKLNNVRKLQRIISKLIGLREKLIDINERKNSITRKSNKRSPMKSKSKKGVLKKIKHKRKKEFKDKSIL